jgi:EAL domain-containing protein (putative c-di-GMP-specific phosphodiesterase class I)
MQEQESEQYNIDEIITEGAVVTHFQPIISLRDKKVVGVEALSRGIHPQTGNIISPLDLIGQAEANRLGLELDRLFRDKALNTYKTIDPAAEVLLFINVNPKILESDDLELGWTNDKVKSLGLKSGQIAIEICESNVVDTEKLIRFVENYRRHGFIIAIDDYGTNHSNLERIIQIRPDIIKIPRELIGGVDNDFYKEAIVRSIIHLAKNIGAVTIAEGVETDQDVLKCHELGIDLYQGFYFARPSDCCTSSYQKCRETIHKTFFKLAGHMRQHIQEKRDQHLRFLETCNTLLKKLETVPACRFSATLSTLDIGRDAIDCLYLLDKDGRQIYKMDLSETTEPYHQHHLFQRIGDNSDHSVKDYFVLSFYNEADIFISDEFVSYTSKNYCKTISAKFISSEGKQHTLCIDFILHRKNSARMKAVAS